MQKPAASVNVHQAKTHFSRLLARVLNGEEVTLAKAGRPVARLVPLSGATKRRIPGTARGKIWVAPDFDRPLSRNDLAAWEKPLP